MNSISVIGRLGKDVEVKYTQASKKYCTFSLAVNGYKDHTNWFRVQAWEALAENCSKFIGKGSQVGVSGSLEVREYEDREGNKRTSVTIQARDVTFMSRKEEGGATQQQPYPPKGDSSGGPSVGYSAPDVSLDDIPF